MPATTENLEIVALVCEETALVLRNLDKATSHELKQITGPGGVASFRFKAVVKINDENFEIQVRKKV